MYGWRQLVAIFDADMICRPEFFLRTLQWMQHDELTIVNTPQYFHNVDLAADIDAQCDPGYWHVVLPGLDAYDCVQCNGSNFVLRAQHAASAGFFPEYCVVRARHYVVLVRAVGVHSTNAE